MALFRCGGGDGMSETVLWTNPSPTSSFGSTIVTLSQGISSFDFIAIEYTLSTTNSNVARAYGKVSELLKGTSDNNTFRCMLFGVKANNGYVYARSIVPQSDTSFTISTAQRMFHASDNNTLGIPIKIIGVKK